MYQYYLETKKEFLEECFYLSDKEGEKIVSFYFLIKKQLFSYFNLKEKENLLKELQAIELEFLKYKNENHATHLIQLDEKRFPYFNRLLNTVRKIYTTTHYEFPSHSNELKEVFNIDYIFLYRIGKFAGYKHSLKEMIADLSTIIFKEKDREIEERNIELINQILISDELKRLEGKIKNFKEDYILSTIYGYSPQASKKQTLKKGDQLVKHLIKMRNFKMNRSNYLTYLKLSKIFESIKKDVRAIEEYKNK